MPAFKRIKISGPDFFETILKPSFGDLVEGKDIMRGLFGEFTVMKDVPYQRKIIDILRLKNVLQRRDASCGTEFSNIARVGLRIISTTELGGAIRMCREELYQGCLKDWRNGDVQFINNIGSYFRNAIATDISSLLYFGDTSLPNNSSSDAFNINKIDGIYTQYKKYLAEGVLPADQTFTIPNGDISPANSVVYLENLYNKRDVLMDIMDDSDMAFYIDKQWASAYESYLIATGQQTVSGANYIQDGINVRAYKGIPIFVNPFFKPILRQITGQNAHFGVLTLRGNFVAATDENYGVGPEGDQALMVWYSEDDDMWKWRTALKLGTQIGLPEHSTVAFPA